MIGTTLSHFKITAKLGEGGMGVVVPVDGSGETFRAGKAEPLLTGEFRGCGQGITIGGFLFSSYDVGPDGRFAMFPGEEEDVGEIHATIVFNWLEDLQQKLAGR